MKICCPECRADDVATVEVIIALARTTEFHPDQNEFEYIGVPLYNETTTATDGSGHPHMHCMGCDYEWYELSVRIDAFSTAQHLLGPVDRESVVASEFQQSVEAFIGFLQKYPHVTIHEKGETTRGAPGQDKILVTHWRMALSFRTKAAFYRGVICAKDIEGPAAFATFTPDSFHVGVLRAFQHNGVWTLQEG